MQKPQNFNRRGFAVKEAISSIVPQIQSPNQVARLKKYVRDREFTTAIDSLEKRNISGDVAIFIFANLQDLEVAR
jgi:hypothetical protein